MNIGLINTYSYNNVGDAAIYTALSQLLKDAPVYSTLRQDTEHTAGIIQYRKNLSNCDVYISVGGDIFNNTRPWLVTRNFLQNMKQLKKSPRNNLIIWSINSCVLHWVCFKAFE